MAVFDHVCMPRCDKPRPDTAQRRVLLVGGSGIGRLGARGVLCILVSAFSGGAVKLHVKASHSHYKS